MLLDYMEGHDYRLSTDKEGNLVRVDVNDDQYDTDEYSVDDLIDSVCEWNYELILHTTEEMKKSDISDAEYSKLEEKMNSLKESSASSISPSAISIKSCVSNLYSTKLKCSFTIVLCLHNLYSLYAIGIDL